MDAVYIYKAKPCQEELRFSLRSIETNLSCYSGKVVVIGDRPRFANDLITWVKFGGLAGSKYDNAYSRIMRAARSANVSEDFILMNDDFIITKPMPRIPAFALDQTIDEWIRDYPADMLGPYYQKIVATRKLIGPDAPSFEVHAPIVYNKARLLALEEKYTLPCGVLLRTLYAHEYGIKPTKLKDRKAKTIAELRRLAPGPFVSTTDEIGATREFREIMGALFPNPSSYERR